MHLLEKDVIKNIKQEAKKRKYKGFGYSIYTVEDDFLFNYDIFVHYDKKSDVSELSYELEVKPLYIDDLFWEIFDMESNKSEPMSLRVNGAFVVRSLILNSRIYEINSNTDYVNKCLNHFSEDVSDFCFKQKKDSEYFNKCIHEYYSKRQDYDLVKLLIKIHNEEYYDAMYEVAELMANNKFGNYTNEDKDIYEYILEYTQKKLGVYKKPNLFSRIKNRFQ